MSHLSILKDKFPGKVVLDVADIAACLSISRDHIYRLSSQKKLPFPVLVGLGDKIQVSIVALANYLDGSLAEVSVAELAKPDFVVKKKIGRPRGALTKVSKLQLSFQGQLKAAITQQEISTALENLMSEVGKLDYEDNNRNASETFENVKLQTMGYIADARTRLTRAFLDLEIETTKKSRPAAKI